MDNGIICPREGDLYAVIEAHGKRFEIYYGYYEEYERGRIEPIPIYPLFNVTPVYTDEGYPFTTSMQEPCCRYSIRDPNIDNERCADCKHFYNEDKCKIGICKCRERVNKSVNGNTAYALLTNENAL